MVVHYLLLVKSITGGPLAYAAIITVLLALRLAPKRNSRQRQRTARMATQQA
jgi:DMSO/TMAO reductase YedYZ heme-binding membrane subunit